MTRKKPLYNTNPSFTRSPSSSSCISTQRDQHHHECELIEILNSFGIKTRVDHDFMNSDHVSNFQTMAAMQNTLPTTRVDYLLAEHFRKDQTQLATCFTCESSSACSDDRFDTIVVRVIVFFKNFKEDVKHLPQHCCNPYQVLNSVVSIVDVDHERKHVYIRVKRSLPLEVNASKGRPWSQHEPKSRRNIPIEEWEHEDGTPRSQYAYYMMGRVDNKSCFLMNFDKYDFIAEDEQFNHFTSINDIYQASTLYNKCNKMTKHGKRTGQSKGSNVKRVFFSTYFVSGAKDPYHRFCFKKTLRSRYTGSEIEKNVELRNGITASQHVYRHCIGKVDLGLYEMELKNWSWYRTHHLLNCLEPEIIHLVNNSC
ncbi:hypothetical protein FDP41_011261 [Naegleria fowleri]|uniref:Uncharacterized protein n=1 Tax=Naegleria fowleri TaxID=5763 RepID=A0A6A5C5G0_NAEFO|nr:uncharacterized protein FDP41_011261 [Naegleria fowleri]KAF0982331.1 hypothetical protein FDP41_011261 [Naegleria fowleri]